jgi:uncharacterized protein YlxW (UPF0749 family)
MTLLTSMMERPLDPGYAAAAQHREVAGLPASTGTRTVTVLVAAFAIGLLLTLSALALRTPSTSAIKAKATLVAQVEAGRAAVDAQAKQLTALQAQVDRLQTQALSTDQSALASRLQTLTVAAGAVAVRGQGLRVVLDDAPSAGGNSADANPRTNADSTDGKVLSKDLQIVVNGLWQAGAEAISVNDQRLTSTSAIRFAGEAILVNYRPLVRPYTINAIGSSKDLQVQFAESDGGAYARALHDNYGIRVSIDQVGSLLLPAASSVSVRYATVPSPERTAPHGGAAPTSSSTPSDTGGQRGRTPSTRTSTQTPTTSETLP